MRIKIICLIFIYITVTSAFSSHRIIGYNPPKIPPICAAYLDGNKFGSLPAYSNSGHESSNYGHYFTEGLNPANIYVPSSRVSVVGGSSINSGSNGNIGSQSNRASDCASVSEKIPSVSRGQIIAGGEQTVSVFPQGNGNVIIDRGNGVGQVISGGSVISAEDDTYVVNGKSPGQYLLPGGSSQFVGGESTFIDGGLSHAENVYPSGQYILPGEQVVTGESGQFVGGETTNIARGSNILINDSPRSSSVIVPGNSHSNIEIHANGPAQYLLPSGGSGQYVERESNYVISEGAPNAGVKLHANGPGQFVLPGGDVVTGDGQIISRGNGQIAGSGSNYVISEEAPNLGVKLHANGPGQFVLPGGDVVTGDGQIISRGNGQIAGSGSNYVISEEAPNLGVKFYATGSGQYRLPGGEIVTGDGQLISRGNGQHVGSGSNYIVSEESPNIGVKLHANGAGQYILPGGKIVTGDGQIISSGENGQSTNINGGSNYVVGGNIPSYVESIHSNGLTQYISPGEELISSNVGSSQFGGDGGSNFVINGNIPSYADGTSQYILPGGQILSSEGGESTNFDRGSNYVVGNGNVYSQGPGQYILPSGEFAGGESTDINRGSNVIVHDDSPGSSTIVVNGGGETGSNFILRENSPNSPDIVVGGNQNGGSYIVGKIPNNDGSSNIIIEKPPSSSVVIEEGHHGGGYVVGTNPINVGEVPNREPLEGAVVIGGKTGGHVALGSGTTPSIGGGHIETGVHSESSGTGGSGFKINEGGSFGIGGGLGGLLGSESSVSGSIGDQSKGFRAGDSNSDFGSNANYAGSNLGFGGFDGFNLASINGGGSLKYLDKEHSGGSEDSSSSVKAASQHHVDGNVQTKTYRIEKQHKNEKTHFRTRVQQIELGPQRVGLRPYYLNPQ